MMIGEVKKWAKAKGYEVKNSNGGYSWRKDSEAETKWSCDVDNLVKDIFNHATDNKWLEYQEKNQ